MPYPFTGDVDPTCPQVHRDHADCGSSSEEGGSECDCERKLLDTDEGR